MGPGLRLGARSWGRLLQLLRPRAGAGWPGARPFAQAQRQPTSVLGLATGARGLWRAVRLNEAVVPAERAATAHVGPRFDIDLLVSLLRQENARDICVIWVSPALKYVDYFVVASGASPRHLQAMAQYLLKTHKFLRSPREAFARIEGKDSEDWLCVDFGCMVVHLMLPGTRETYELEKLWTLGTWDDQLAQIAPEVLPEDFILGFSPEGEPSAFPPLEFKRK
ncbi:mitochondrial assembly of ribosomal large subunit protein 1 isoform X1 [Monodelphis domestica]|uniref:Mitochondrial assembly of ribosomal large subunit protein 1 n=1 Tax=Monodelphis domestica TaxID=13616 RepID=F6ZF75_MONDO|nr:mitochondrial assembly of ribosomal large subunit protein 1 isoform X1 [Monodelphis domestica]